MAHDDGPFIFRINENGSGPNLLVQVCSERGWREYNENTPLRDNWNLWWRTNGFPSSTYKSLKMWQFTNHIPKASSICRKDTLARYLRCMRKVYGSVYDFSPSVYNLPLEYNKLVAECSRNRTATHEDDDVWICKPVGLSQGRGIYLFRRLSELTYDTNTIVQRYIRNPLLIGGYKCDLRLYVCVTSYRPLAIYLYREGIVRFSTDKFSLNDLDNPFCHLTNCSLNKMGPGYFEKKDRVGSGCKWTLKQLRHYFTQSGMADWLLWQRVAAIVVLTVLTQVPFIPSSPNCFEFLGFDILVDSSLRPWLLEVNLSPALGNDCDVDPAVKKPMLHDLFDLLGLPVRNTGLSLFTLWDSPSTTPVQAQAASLLQRAAGSGLTALLNSAGEPPLAVVSAAQHWRRHHQKQQQNAVLARRRQRVCSSGGSSCGSRGANASANADASAIAIADGEPDPEDDGSSVNGRQSPIAGRQRGTGRGRGRRGVRRGLSAPTVTSGSEPSSPRSTHQAPAAPLATRHATSHARQAGGGGGGGGGGAGCGRRVPASPSPSQPPPAAAYIAGPQVAPALRVTSVRLCTQRGSSTHNASVSAKDNANASTLPLAPEMARGDAKTTDASASSTHTHAYSSRTRSACRILDPLLMDRVPRHQPTRTVSQRFRGTQPLLWGNGKDWRAPVAREGDWVRLYPMSETPPLLPSGGAGGGPGTGFGSSSNGASSPFGAGSVESASGAVGDPEVRRAVAEVNRMLRVARDVARKYTNSNDVDRNKALAENMSFNGEVWLPHK